MVNYKALNGLVLCLVALAVPLWLLGTRDNVLTYAGQSALIVMLLIIGAYCSYAVIELRHRLAAARVKHVCLVEALKVLAGHAEEQLVVARLVMEAEGNPRALRGVFADMPATMVVSVAWEIDRRVVETRDAFVQQIQLYHRNGSLQVEQARYTARLRQLEEVLREISFATEDQAGAEVSA